MEIRDNEKFYIIEPLSPKLDLHESKRIIDEINNETRIIGLDLSYVYECTLDFIESLKNICTQKNIGIFNINSDIFTLFNYMKLDKTANLFVSELDFKENTRQLINRNFSII